MHALFSTNSKSSHKLLNVLSLLNYIDLDFNNLFSKSLLISLLFSLTALKNSLRLFKSLSWKSS